MNNQNLLLSGSLNAGVNASDWKVNEVIKGMWEILFHSPAQRDIPQEQHFREIITTIFWYMMG